MLAADRLIESWAWKTFLVDLCTRMNRPADAPG
jgi:hypothetical protein